MPIYVGFFLICSVFGNCKQYNNYKYSSMTACLKDVDKVSFGICRKMKGDDFVGFVSRSKSFAPYSYGDVK